MITVILKNNLAKPRRIRQGLEAASEFSMARPMSSQGRTR
jgi:hypothetical protein